MDGPRENQKEFIKNDKLILNAPQRFRSDKHIVVTEKVNKITLSANVDKRYVKKEIKCNNIIKQCKND